MRDPHQIINKLSPGDALAILKSLAASDAQLARRIAEIATAQLSQVDPEEVAAVLHEELNALQVEEVWDRASSTRHGYVEPGEAADQMIEEVAPVIFAEAVVDAWKAGSPSQADIAAIKTFIEEELGGWGARLVQRHR